MKLRSISYTFIFLMLIVGFSACNNQHYFEQNKEIKAEKWSSNDRKTFQIDILDTNSLFNFYLNVRNTNEYPYANLYIFIESVFPDSAIARDTLELQLANMEGKWLGSGYGRYKYNSFILRKGMRFVQTGSYSFTLEQGMRQDSLIGISDVGIKLSYDDDK